MTQDQMLSMLRSALTIIGTLAAIYGGVNAETWALISGAAITIAPIVWGVYVHSKTGTIAAASAMPEVRSMGISDPALARAAVDADKTTIVSIPRG